jgi:predicted RNase H-like HicB family nuclease
MIAVAVYAAELVAPFIPQPFRLQAELGTVTIYPGEGEQHLAGVVVLTVDRDNSITVQVKDVLSHSTYEIDMDRFYEVLRNTRPKVPEPPDTAVAYPVLLQRLQDGLYEASVPCIGLPAETGVTPQEALRNLQRTYRRLVDRFADSLPPPPEGSPWR